MLALLALQNEPTKSDFYRQICLHNAIWPMPNL